MTRKYAAAVIGAGPAGLAVVGRLLDKRVHPIAWVDPAFQGGRLIKYPEVSSNTKVKLFLNYAKASPSFVSAISHEDSSLPSPIAPLESLDPEQGCALALVQQMCQHLSSRLRKVFPKELFAIEGWVDEIQYDASTELYACQVYPRVADTFDSLSPPDLSAAPSAPVTLFAERLYLCTGSEPVVPPADLDAGPRLPLDVCLQPSALRERVRPGQHVHVVGASHSGVLCAKHAVACGAHVTLAARHAFVYAEDRGTSIVHDNRGLKLAAAAFARRIERGDVDVRVVDAQCAPPRADHTVYAVGFEARQCPRGTLPARPTYDPHSGVLHAVPRCAAFGIAFPEQVVDPSGETEWNVGLWKFMKYIQRVV